MGLLSVRHASIAGGNGNSGNGNSDFSQSDVGVALTQFTQVEGGNGRGDEEHEGKESFQLLSRYAKAYKSA